MCGSRPCDKGLLLFLMILTKRWIMRKQKKKKIRKPRIPTPPPTEWHKDGSKYDRKDKHKRKIDGDE